MCRAIEAAHAVDEVKDIRDRAVALEHYARQAQNTDAERRAAEIRLRAERKAGQLLSAMDKALGGRSPTPDKRYPEGTATPPTLKELGISKKQSSTWQKLGALPQNEFDFALGESVKPPTTKGILRSAADPKAGFIHVLDRRRCDMVAHGGLSGHHPQPHKLQANCGPFDIRCGQRRPARGRVSDAEEGALDRRLALLALLARRKRKRRRSANDPGVMTAPGESQGALRRPSWSPNMWQSGLPPLFLRQWSWRGVPVGSSGARRQRTQSDRSSSWASPSAAHSVTRPCSLSISRKRSKY